MKNIYLLITLLSYFASFAQINEVNGCGTDFLIENQNQFDQKFEDYYQQHIAFKQKNPVTYYIPVVFHVVHTGEAVGTGSNVSDYTIYSTLKSLNNHFLNNHNDAKSSNSNIQFVLATKAPDGSCSKGINRINYSSNQTYVQYGNQYETTNNGVAASTIRALSNWDPTKYYNIWVVNKITSSTNVAAYAYLAPSHGTNYDGTFIAYPYLDPLETTLPHEIGHSLNLHHTFQGSTGTNCPAQINGCGTDGDCVSDTPPHSQTHAYDVNLTAYNSCSGNNDSSFKNNYMAYTRAEFRTAFTPLQIARMQSAITYYRSSYLKANNSVFTMTKAPTADFYVNNSNTNYKQFFCPGTPITLLNSSSCFLNTFNKTTLSNYSAVWEIKKNNQTIQTSAEPNPTITLSQPGTYSIALTVTNNAGKSVLTKNDIIEIIQPKSSVTYCSPNSTNIGNFKHSIDKVTINAIKNSSPIGRTEGYTNYSCTHITQVSSTSQNKIEIAASNNHPSATNPLTLNGYIDYNQNGTFETNELVFSQTVPIGTANKTYTMFFLAPTNVKLNEVLRMRIVSESGSIPLQKVNCNTSFYLGDIEDYGLIFVQNLSNTDLSLANVKVFPNPVSDVLTIDTNTSDAKTIEIYTVSGQLIEQVKTNDSKISINVEKLTPGTYLLKINETVQKIIKK